MPRRWTRHHCHLITYGLVSLSLMFMGMIFSIFAIFVKENDLSKVWLAGPTTIAVGLVLCGKGLHTNMSSLPTLEGEDLEDEDLCDEDSLPDGEVPEKIHVHKDVINSIDAQYEKRKQEVSLFIPNAGLKEKDMILLNERKEKSPPETDIESAIWNPRTSLEGLNEDSERGDGPSPSTTLDSKKSEDCLCVLSNEQADNALLPLNIWSVPDSNSVLNKSSKLSSNQGDKRRNLSLSKELQFPRETKPFVENNPSPLYQGETFVLHEKQYLI